MPDNNDLKKSIQTTLSAFEDKMLADAARALLNALGYQSDKTLPIKPNTADTFQVMFDPQKQMTAEAKLDEWKSVDLLFQVTSDEISTALKGQESMFVNKRVDNALIESYLFFAIELTGRNYSRKDLAGITREVNKCFKMPALIVFKHGETITFSIIAWRISKKDESKDVLEKVTLIKDIRFTGNRAHIEILHDLALSQLAQAHHISNFVDLQKAWEKTLDLNELNKKFYKEIANWYFWAVKSVKFPKDAEKDEATRNATGVIRLITRLIFVWFIKEKGLVPEDLFDPRWLKDNLDFSDAKKSTYYKAILQNLFFATLNTEMGADRVFRRENAKGQDPDYLMSNFYRYKRYFKQPDAALELFAQIPFLNGGLFECLDKEIEKGNVIRVDGFSDRDDNPLTVPDDLFLMEKEKEIDLNEVYATKNKKYKVRGLIHIFNSYKFTIEENTPIEEEIALDPELLGKVFENLLAAYNPETGTTARKQTGSFYTPREIVNYMVDEALLAYLESSLAPTPLPQGEGQGVRERLRDLLSYNPAVPDFTEDEKARLIAAIDNIKVLDPACGSGAFPMGALHKLVFLLGKLDPNNEGWKQRQLDKAYEMTSVEAREAAIKSTEDVFENNHDDYGRKLYLIENCIYGVDIQPIAVQIAKLRFFISLVVEQKKNATKPNLGILQLPNLETKFVAANTLIGINRPDTKPAEEKTVSVTPEIETLCNNLLDSLRQFLKVTRPEVKAQWLARAKEQGERINTALQDDPSFQPLAIDWIFNTAKDVNALKVLLPVKREAKASPLVLRNQEIETKEKELERVRREHFSARTPATKRKYRDLDKKLRLEIADLLSKNHALEDEAAQQLAGWDPYNQNAHADFFDPEWMFGIEGGFDVVIGNPPYVRVDEIAPESRTIYRELFATTTGKYDLYYLFFEKSLNLLSTKGTLSFITPNKFCAATSASTLRNLIFNNSSYQEIVSTSLLGVFEDAANYPVISILSNAHKDSVIRTREAKSMDALHESTEASYELNRSDFSLFPEHLVPINVSQKEINLAIRLIKTNAKLGEFLSISEGLRIPSKYETESGDIGIVKQYQFEKWTIVRDGSFITKKNLTKVISETSDRYQKIIKDKILIAEDALIITATIDSDKNIPQGGVYFGVATQKDVQVFSVLGLLNSLLLSFLYRILFGGMHMGSGYLRYRTNFLENLPFPNLSSEQEQSVTKLVTKILAAKRADPEGGQADTSALEGEIDQLVYQLYGLSQEEIDIVEGRQK